MTSSHAFLKRAAEAYYDGNPIISDEQFDRLAEAVGYNQVGAKQHSHLCKHYYPLYSLQKFYADEGKDTPLGFRTDLIQSPKLDGAAVEHLYIDGIYARTVTRGDGIEGVNVTANFINSGLIPLKISLKGAVQIAGEVVATKDTKNSRNYAAGALGLKDPQEFNSRNLKFFAYSVYPYITDSYMYDMKTLNEQGFSTALFSPTEAYPKDGIVYRIDSNADFDSLGYTADFPRGAYAEKVRAETVQTKLLSVDWQVGKTGRVTPVANLEPVYIGDKLVSKVTLNNPGFIEALDLNIGDTVLVRMAGEIIPELVSKFELASPS